jgi:hypothetical protein
VNEDVIPLPEPPRTLSGILKRYYEKFLSVVLADIILGTAIFDITAVALLVWFVVAATFIESGFWAGVFDAVAFFIPGAVYTVAIVLLAHRAWDLVREFW